MNISIILYDDRDHRIVAINEDVLLLVMYKHVYIKIVVSKKHETKIKILYASMREKPILYNKAGKTKNISQ